MARSWASYEEVTPIDTVEGHDYDNEVGDYENGDDRRSSSGGRRRRCKYIFVCLVTLLAIAGVLVGTYFILAHYKMLPASLQFINKAQPPTSAPVIGIPPATPVLNDTATFQNEEKNTNATMVPMPEGNVSSLCSKAYIDTSSDSECVKICAAGECCTETAVESCFADNVETCQLYSPCEILTQGNGTDATQNITNTSVATISPPDTSLGDISSLCSKEYIDRVSRLECTSICSSGACCLPSAIDYCFADNQNICKLYSPCMILIQESEGNSTTDTIDYSSSGNTTEASGMESNGMSYCGFQLPGGGDSAVSCSKVLCTTDSDCEGDQSYPACLNVCPQNLTGSGSADNLEGAFNQSDVTGGSEYPSGMPPAEEFNDTLPTVYSYCGLVSGSGSYAQPRCSPQNCTSDLDCKGNRSFPDCLKQCGPSSSGMNENGNMNGFGDGMGSAPETYGNMSGSDSGMGNLPGVNDYGDMSEYGSGSGFPGMSGMLPPEGFQEAVPTGYYYCGKNSTSSSVSQPICSSTNCTSNDDCSKNRTFPVCLKACGPSISSGVSDSTNSANSGTRKQRHPTH